MASPCTGTTQQEGALTGSVGGHGAMLGDMARLSSPLGPIACSACSWHLHPDNVPGWGFWSEVFAICLLPYGEGSYLGFKKPQTTRTWVSAEIPGF